MLQLRGADKLNEVTEVLHEEKKVASIRRMTFDDPISRMTVDHTIGDLVSFKFLQEYEVEVAEGIDTSLVLPLFALHHFVRGQKWGPLIVRAGVCYGYRVSGAF